MTDDTIKTPDDADDDNATEDEEIATGVADEMPRPVARDDEPADEK